MKTQILLKQQMLDLKGNHLCLIYDKDRIEQMPALIPFMKQGLENDEQFVYIADDLSVEQLSLLLKMNRIDVEAESNRGALKLWTRKEWIQPGELDSRKKCAQIRIQVSCIYTNCADICRIISAKLTAFKNKLKQHAQVMCLDLADWVFLTGDKNYIDPTIKVAGMQAIKGSIISGLHLIWINF